MISHTFQKGKKAKIFTTGFTLVETLIGAAIFLMVSLSIYGVYQNLFVFIAQNQNKVLALNLVNEQFEIARNLPYADVGIVGGIPNGKIPHVQTISRGNVVFTVTSTVRNVDLPFDGTLGGSPNDLSPADNKLVEVEINCEACKGFTPLILTSIVAPKNLETASTNGALFVRVFDANGVALPGASVHIENNQATSSIVIDDVTDINGMLQIVDAPPGIEAYEITVSKSGYSTDRTYSPDAENPSPLKPHATVVLQQVTQVSFSIDRISSLTVRSVTDTCVPVGNVDFSLRGGKLIGADVPKYSEDLSTNGSGIYTDPALEWDTYTVGSTDASHDIQGLNPLNPLGVNPGSDTELFLIMASKNSKSLLVSVKDSATGLPVTDATVNLTSGTFEDEKSTGRGYINQTDWSGGSGQETLTDFTRYASAVGIETGSPAGELKIRNVSGTYLSDASLESSTIDTGSESNFYNLVFDPIDQPLQSGEGSVRFQFATSPSSTPPLGWEWKGPDGTSGTYYSLLNDALSPAHNGHRYARYKLFLHTENDQYTPNVSDIAFTFTSSCTPPGQVIFSGLQTGMYTITVSKAGYGDTVIDVPVAESWQEQEIILAP